MAGYGIWHARFVMNREEECGEGLGCTEDTWPSLRSGYWARLDAGVTTARLEVFACRSSDECPGTGVDQHAVTVQIQPVGGRAALGSWNGAAGAQDQKGNHRV